MKLYTFNKHVKWRVDSKDILICDCKRLIDLKISKDFENSMKKFDRGIFKEELTKKEALFCSDFERLNLLTTLSLRQITTKDFSRAMKILENEFKTGRVRSNNFLFQKFKRCPKFFIGAFLDNELIGVICGFPRENYLLMSELAIDSRFQKRKIGRRLVKSFENVSKGYKEIRAGAEDSAIGFYYKCGYSPFLLVQYPKNLYKKEDFSEFKLVENKFIGGEEALSFKVTRADLSLLNDLRQRFTKAYFQYIFIKKL